MPTPAKVKITKDRETSKKYKAEFYDKSGKKVKTTRFGQDGASDYTRHKDDERKQRYIDRHRKRENWNNPTSAGALSRYVLWNKKSVNASVSDYKRKFGLK
jgi:hypothetical protein